MPFSTEVGLGPGHIVLDGDPVSPMQWGIAAPTFQPCLFPCKEVPFWGRDETAPHLGGQVPQNPQF